MIENYAVKFLKIFDIMQMNYFKNIDEKGDFNNEKLC